MLASAALKHAVRWCAANNYCRHAAASIEVVIRRFLRAKVVTKITRSACLTNDAALRLCLLCLMESRTCMRSAGDRM